MRAPTISLYVLAGGRSSRFGSNKALAVLQGRPLVHHVIDQFAGLQNPILVAPSQTDYRHLGLTAIGDPIPGLGPIGGLLAACEHSSSPGWILLSGCDTLFSDPAAFGLLLSAVKDREVQAIAFRGTHWEPMPALYHTSILPAVRQHIGQGKRSLWRLIDEVPHRALAFPGDRSPILHINTPEDLVKLQRP